MFGSYSHGASNVDFRIKKLRCKDSIVLEKIFILAVFLFSFIQISFAQVTEDNVRKYYDFKGVSSSKMTPSEPKIEVESYYRIPNFKFENSPDYGEAKISELFVGLTFIF